MRGKLDTIAHRFNTRIRILSGQDFFGLLLPAPVLSTSGQMNPQRYLRTTINPPVHFGDVIQADTQKFIVAEHGEGYYSSPIYQHFKLYPVDDEFVLETTNETTDSVTGEVIRSHGSPLQTVYLSYITQTARSEELIVGQNMKTAVCNALVLPGDKVGGFICTKSAPVLGVYMIELKQL